MKKGLLFRLIVLVLVCTMLFGLVGFSSLEPKEQTADTQDAETIVTDANEPGTGDEGNPADPTPTQEPEEKEDGFTVTVKKPAGGTLALKDAAWPENAKETADEVTFVVEENAELSFVATADKTAIKSEFVAATVEYAEADGKIVKDKQAGAAFEVKVDKDITVSAEFFGIKSVTVSKDGEWANAKDGGKTVTVKTFGATDVQLVGGENDGKYIKLESSANGEYVFKITKDIGTEAQKFTVTATKTVAEAATLVAETTVDVKMIDLTPPDLSESTKRIEPGRRGDYVYYTAKATDNISGIASIYYEYRDAGETAWHSSSAHANNLKGVSSTTLTHGYYSGTNYRVTAVDVSGNKATYDFGDESAPDITAIESTVGTVEDIDGKTVAWIGNGGQLKISAQDATAVNFINIINIKDGIPEVTEGKPEQAEPQSPVYYSLFNITESGEYTVSVGDGNKTAEYKLDVRLDPNAPKITSATYNSAPTNDNWLTRFINKISGGHLFNEMFEIKFVTNDGEDDADKNTFASGIDKAEYLLVEGEEIDLDNLPDGEWTAAKYENNSGSATVSISKDFTGYVALRVYDKAGNCKCVVVGFTDENGDSTKGELITNEATFNDESRGDGFNPQLTVMAKTDKVDKDGKTIEVDYVASENDKNNWAKKVKFTIYATMPNLQESDDGTTYAYEDAVPTVTATYDNGKTLQVDRIIPSPDEEVPDNIYVFTATIGNAGNVSYSGDITFDVSCKAKVTTTNDTDEPVKTSEDITIHGSSVNVKVNVQNFLNAATVNIAVNDDENLKPAEVGNVNGWYNAQDNVLSEATIFGCADSLAPYTTHYTVKYLTYQGYKANEAAKVDADLVGTIGTTEDAKETTKGLVETLTANPGIYFVEVWSEDAAGNYSYGPGGVEYNKDNPAVYTFKVDTEQPTITAIFSSNAKENITYYNYQRTVEIRVCDASFDQSDKDSKDSIVKNFTVAVDGDGINNSFDESYSRSEWTYVDPEDDVPYWTTTYYIGNKENNGLGGKDGDNYNVTIVAQDIAGNKVRTNTDGNMYYGSNEQAENGYNAYSTYDVKDFSMDQTKPVVTVEFDYNTASHERYFNKGRTATITVKEHNFNEKWAKITVNGNSGESGWNSDGDTHTKKVYFANDADCTFAIEVIDKARNICTDKEVTYIGTACKDFVIDLTAPELGTTGTQAGPFNENCTPGFSGKDTNMQSNNGSADYTVRLTRSVREHRNEDVTARFAAGNVTMGSDTISAIYANIPDDAANDGIYTLTVSVTDLAGNSSETSSTFTVNRHGSFYIFNKDLADLVNAKFVQKADGKYSVTEYNASPLVSGSVKIEIYRDNKLIETLKPTIAAGSIGESGLYEYTYDIPAKYFNQDGRYKVWISSEDEATNLSDNTKLEDAAIMFTVDTVAPEIKIIKGLEKARVNAEELEFTANVIDTYGIGSIQIFVDGELVKEYVTQDMYDSLKAKGKDMSIYEVLTENLDFMAAYTLLESTSTQDVEIKVTDMAGNVLTTADEDFDPVYDFHDSVLVSTSFFARYIHNPLALVATGVVIAGAVWFILAKKKKEEKAAA